MALILRINGYKHQRTYKLFVCFSGICVENNCFLRIIAGWSLMLHFGREKKTTNIQILVWLSSICFCLNNCYKLIKVHNKFYFTALWIFIFISHFLSVLNTAFKLFVCVILNVVFLLLQHKTAKTWFLVKYLINIFS